jgi:hypothetical protein
MVMAEWLYQAHVLTEVDVEGLLMEWGGSFVLERQEWVRLAETADAELVALTRRAGANSWGFRVVAASPRPVYVSATGGRCVSVPVCLEV